MQTNANWRLVEGTANSSLGTPRYHRRSQDSFSRHPLQPRPTDRPTDHPFSFPHSRSSKRCRFSQACIITPFLPPFLLLQLSPSLRCRRTTLARLRYLYYIGHPNFHPIVCHPCECFRLTGWRPNKVRHWKRKVVFISVTKRPLMVKQI